jgi:hypothetical protein
VKLSCSASVAYPDPHHFGKTDPDLQQRENFYPDQRLNGKFNPRGASTATSAPLEALAVFRIRMRIQQIHMFLGFPDPDPPVGIWIRNFLSSSKINCKKNLDSFCFWTLLDFLSLKNYVNVPSKSRKSAKTFFF